MVGGTGICAGAGGDTDAGAGARTGGGIGVGVDTGRSEEVALFMLLPGLAEGVVLGGEPAAPAGACA